MTRRLLEFLRAEPRPSYLERISVESRGQVHVVRIDSITASGRYAELHVGDKTYAVRERMQTLGERLDSAVFFRIHRSAIVQLDRIDALVHRPGGDYAVRLKDAPSSTLAAPDVTSSSSGWDRSEVICRYNVTLHQKRELSSTRLPPVR